MGCIQAFDVEQIVEKTGVKTFIETGTLHGEGVEYAKAFPFEQIHSIEIISNLAEAAKHKFADDHRIKIHQGHSADVLEELLPKIDTSILFWLDAHFPGADSKHSTAGGENVYDRRVPLESEIKIISQRAGKFKDVLVIDDLWLYEDGPFETGSFNDWMKIHHNGETRQDLCGSDASFIENAFKDTHDIQKFYKQQGYIVCTPKK
tara:strand:+ start:8749 stop:9363 length:615 start_codon:yes stop_codon:yes gene_type:complete